MVSVALFVVVVVLFVVLVKSSGALSFSAPWAPRVEPTQIVLDANDRATYDALSRQLEALGFSALGEFLIVNVTPPGELQQKNSVQVWSAPNGIDRCELAVTESTNANGQKGVTTIAFGFVSKKRSGGKILTVAAPTRAAFPPVLPDTSRRVFYTDDAALVLAEHARHVEAAGGYGAHLEWRGHSIEESTKDLRAENEFLVKVGWYVRREDRVQLAAATKRKMLFTALSPIHGEASSVAAAIPKVLIAGGVVFALAWMIPLWIGEPFLAYAVYGFGVFATSIVSWLFRAPLTWAFVLLAPSIVLERFGSVYALWAGAFFSALLSIQVANAWRAAKQDRARAAFTMFKAQIVLVGIIAVVGYFSGRSLFDGADEATREHAPPPHVVDKVVVRPGLAHAWAKEVPIETDFAKGALRQERAAELVVTTGTIAASDAFIRDDAPPIRVAIPRGRHPVLLTIFDTGEDRRVAFARVELNPQSAIPAVWKAAGGIAVDSGTAAFFDVAARRLEHAIDVLGDREHGVLAADEKTGANIVAFASGYGDGGYPVYVGFDPSGAPIVVLIDFLITAEPEQFDVEAAIAEVGARISAGDGLALSTRAGLHRRVGDLASALADLDKAVLTEPTKYQYFMERGKTHLLRHDFLAASADAKRAFELAHHLGMSAAEAEAYRDAVSLVPAMISTDDMANGIRFRALALRGKARAASGEHKEAIAELDRALELGDELVQRHESMVRKVAANAPSPYAADLASIRVDRARVKKALGDLDAAIADFEVGCKHAPEYCMELALAFREKGDTERANALIDGTVADALHALEKAEQQGRGYVPPALRTLADVHCAMKDLKSTVNILTKLKEAQPKDAEVLVELASTKIDAGDHRGAVEDASAALAQTPKNAMAYFHRARANKALNQDADAAADFQRALDLSANAPLVKRAMERSRSERDE